MSDNRKVTRYVLAYGTIERDVHGPFVEYEEYAKLEALVKKLKAERRAAREDAVRINRVLEELREEMEAVKRITSNCSLGYEPFDDTWWAVNKQGTTTARAKTWFELAKKVRAEEEGHE